MLAGVVVFRLKEMVEKRERLNLKRIKAVKSNGKKQKNDIEVVGLILFVNFAMKYDISNRHNTSVCLYSHRNREVD